MAPIRTTNIATPIVWAGIEVINQFANRISNLIEKINQQFASLEENIRIGNAIIDVHSTGKRNTQNQLKNVNIQWYETSQIEREKRGMAYWWFACIQRAFEISNLITDVLYLPIDISWGVTNNNTVSDSFRLFQMIKLLVDYHQDALLIGNYKSSLKKKEFIEKKVFAHLTKAYPQHPHQVTRVRSEFWGISRDLFFDFNQKYLANVSSEKPIADPSLFLILFCLNENKNILPFDLGYYQAQGKYPLKKVMVQIQRAKSLIDEFKAIFYQKRNF